MEYMIIENDLEKALFFDRCGVDRIFIDLEKIGKIERQGHLDTVISDHCIGDIQKIKSVLKKAKIHVRVNPLNSGSRDEINRCIESGADTLMLPMFTTKKEVQAFISMVDSRAKVSLLLETPKAFFRIAEILELGGIDEIHIGLNDLSIGIGLEFMLEIYTSPILRTVCELITVKGISLGIGGIAPLEGGKVPGRSILVEATSLGASRFILSRAFDKSNLEVFEKKFKELRNFKLDKLSIEKIYENKKELVEKVIKVRESISK